MAVPPIARPPTPRASRVRFGVVPALSVSVLVGSAAGALDGRVALAAGAGATALWATVLLVRAALAIHHTDGTFVACRGFFY